MDYKKLWEEVKANSRVLEACAGHDFSKDPGKLKYVCSKCGGWVNGSAVYWYKQGRKHGRAEKSS